MNKEYLNILREDGIVTIPDYYDKHQCQKIISQIEKISLTKNVISKRDEGIGGDIRIFNFEDESSMGLQFAKNNFLQNLVSMYLGTKLETKSVLAGKVVFNKRHKTNSGGDWHRDADLSQMKAMLYLTDVSEDNGPFTFIKNSNDFDFKRQSKKYPFLERLIYIFRGLPTKPPRYSDDYVKNQDDFKKNIIKVTGKAGTLVIFDGGYIHRGDVIRDGIRYTITNYYYPIINKTAKFYIKSFLKNILNLNNPNIKKS